MVSIPIDKGKSCQVSDIEQSDQVLEEIAPGILIESAATVNFTPDRNVWIHQS